MMQDLGSKYGTLLRLDSPLLAPTDQYQTLQVGSSLVWLRAKSRQCSLLKSLLCCRREETEETEGEPDPSGRSPQSSDTGRSVKGEVDRRAVASFE